tara:strand:- start:458 stop:1399 length:942 start_codon:yes stop_codon:yes gene_type:complete
LIYIVFGTLWILFSDAALHSLVDDPLLENQLQTVKGWFYVLVTGALVFWLTRVMAHTLATEIDERQRAQNELQIALQDAERANQAKSEFLATMSHEFRTPLNAILGFSDILRAQYFGPLGTPKYNEYVDDIHQSGAVMLALVNDILDIAEIEAGKRPIQKSDHELFPLLDICRKSFLTQAESKKIDLQLDIPETDLKIFGDHVSIIQIVTNLVANAIKYTPAGGHVRMSAEETDDHITVHVRDNGIGIPPDKLPTIAEPFAQVRNDPHLTRDGKGLGLAIVKSLIDAHNGKLTIDSIPGDGTTMTVHFPKGKT